MMIEKPLSQLSKSQIINKGYSNLDETDGHAALLPHKPVALCAITYFITVPNSKDYFQTHVPSTYKKLTYVSIAFKYWAQKQ